MSAADTLPDFLCIGAQKSGTSWLWRNLSAHPEIWMPYVKEIHYFDQKALLGRQRLWGNLRGTEPEHLRWRRQFSWRFRSHRHDFSTAVARWDLRYFFGRPTDAWYASLFRPGRGHMKGEVTPSYCTLDEDGVRRVHALLPDARILFFMRHPIERAWSGAMMFKTATRSREEGVARNLAGENSRLRTEYLRTLDLWRAVYPEERIFVGFLEDVHFHPDELLSRIYDFLGVGDAPPAPFVDEQVNRGAASTIPAEVVARLAQQYGELIDELDRTFGGYAAWWRYSRDRLVEPGDGADVVYPFYETSLWNEWLATRDGAAPAVQSGSLAALREPARVQ